MSTKVVKDNIGGRSVRLYRKGNTFELLVATRHNPRIYNRSKSAYSGEGVRKRVLDWLVVELAYFTEAPRDRIIRGLVRARAKRLLKGVEL